MIKLSKEESEKLLELVVEYLAEHPVINNRTLRSIAPVSYDQAIAFFNLMIKEGRLEKIGVGRATNYTLPK